MKNEGIDWVRVMRDPERFALEVVTVDGDQYMRLEHLRTGLKVSIVVGLLCEQTRLSYEKTLCDQLAFKFTDAKLLEHGKHPFACQVRCVYANQLLEVIAKHGRRFFYCPKTERVARLVYDTKVHLIDAKTGTKIVLRNNGSWTGFSHGGTLRELVTMMRDYVTKGTRIGMHFIGMERTFGDGNIWGYPADALQACREAASLLPITTPHEKERAA